MFVSYYYNYVSKCKWKDYKNATHIFKYYYDKWKSCFRKGKRTSWIVLSHIFSFKKAILSNKNGMFSYKKKVKLNVFFNIYIKISQIYHMATNKSMEYIALISIYIMMTPLIVINTSYKILYITCKLNCFRQKLLLYNVVFVAKLLLIK